MIKGPLNLPAPKSELDIRRTMESLAEHNPRFHTILRGAGAERHSIPAAVARLALRLVEVHRRLVERAVGSGRYVGEKRTDALYHTPQMELP